MHIIQMAQEQHAIYSKSMIPKKYTQVNVTK